MLQRAFTSPGEVSAENLDTGVPMQILPAQLSISTIGCPLFNPMQRFFIDFGTGTSLDSVYFVTAVDTTIGKDGYKTDLKMSYGQGFATYVSINKQLAMMTANYEALTPTTGDTQPVESPATTLPDPPTDTELRNDLRRELDELERRIKELTAAELYRLEQIKSFLEAKVIAAGEAVKETARRKVAALTPAAVQAAIDTAKTKVIELQNKVEEQRAALLAAAEGADKTAKLKAINETLVEIFEAQNAVRAAGGAL
jgi:flagellar biosynthesis chaperone FliJ